MGRTKGYVQNDFYKKCLCIVLSSIFVVTSFNFRINDVYATEAVANDTKKGEAERYINYQEYISNYKDVKQPNHEIIVQANSYVEEKDIEVSVLANFKEKNNVLQLAKGKGFVNWNVEIPEEGLYNLSLLYSPLQDASTDISVTLEIDGKMPFSEILSSVMSSVWKDSTGIEKDKFGNDIRPKQERQSMWMEHEFKNFYDSKTRPYLFYFSKGNHSIKINSEGAGFLLDTIKIYQAPETPAYSSVVDIYNKLGYKQTSGIIKKVQAENTYLKSHSILAPAIDRSSPLTEPSDPYNVLLNTIGSEKWSNPGQWISWQVDAPESGLYQIAFKYRQNLLQGMFTTRKLFIDGKTNFSGLEAIHFNFDEEWNMKVLGDDKPFLFYLEKGTHEVKLEVVWGEVGEIIKDVEGVIFDLNELYRDIIMITGLKPDSLRDYFIEKQIPNIAEDFRKSSDRLEAVSEKMKGFTGKTGDKVSQIQNAAYILKTLADNPEGIKDRLSKYTDMVSSLSGLISEINKQTLELDYLVLYSPDQKLQAVKPNVLQKMLYAFKSFISSFRKAPTTSSKNDDKAAIRVWVNSGRDQASVLKNMVDDTFTPQSEIKVNVELVQASLIESTLAGRNPDVALNRGSSEPVNFALRGALQDLSVFDDFKKTTKRFHNSAITPLSLKNAYYALPETQMFDMMFYRKDILEKFNLKVPQTWDEFYKVVPVIQRNNMEVGLPPLTAAVGAGTDTNPPGQSLFATFLFQRGGDFYKKDLKSTAFDEKPAIDAFEKITELYNRYDFPLQYDLFSRFRTGDMPLAIASYNAYNTISVGAPEIKGLWDMAPIPGTRRPDGSIDRSENSHVTACIMFENSENKEASWEFMKWWTSEEAQTRYGLELEALMGTAARYTSANVGVMSKLPWDSNQYRDLTTQWEQVKGVPEIPGSYFTAFGLSNAFRTTVIEYKNGYQALFKWNKYINDEISRKYKEFGIK